MKNKMLVGMLFGHSSLIVLISQRRVKDYTNYLNSKNIRKFLDWFCSFISDFLCCKGSLIWFYKPWCGYTKLSWKWCQFDQQPEHYSWAIEIMNKKVSIHSVSSFLDSIFELNQCASSEQERDDIFLQRRWIYIFRELICSLKCNFSESRQVVSEQNAQRSRWLSEAWQ